MLSVERFDALFPVVEFVSGGDGADGVVGVDGGDVELVEDVGDGFGAGAGFVHEFGGLAFPEMAVGEADRGEPGVDGAVGGEGAAGEKFALELVPRSGRGVIEEFGVRSLEVGGPRDEGTEPVEGEVGDGGVAVDGAVGGVAGEGAVVDDMDASANEEGMGADGLPRRTVRARRDDGLEVVAQGGVEGMPAAVA